MNAPDKPRASWVAPPGEGTIAKRVAAGLGLRPSPLTDWHFSRLAIPFLWVEFGTIPLAWLDSGFPPLAELKEPFLFGFTWLEKRLIQHGPQPRLQNLLSLWADEDDPFLIVMLSLPRLWRVLPHLALSVDVACSHLTGFTGTHSGEPLHFHHRPYLPGNIGLDGNNESIGNGLDRLGFTDP